MLLSRWNRGALGFVGLEGKLAELCGWGWSFVLHLWLRADHQSACTDSPAA